MRLNMLIDRPEFSDAAAPLEKFRAPYQHALRDLANQVRELGIGTGSKNIPPSNATSLDMNENEIKHLTEKKLAACRAHYEQRLRDQFESLEGLADEIKDKSAATNIAKFPDHCHAQIEKILVEAFSELLDLRHDQLSKEAELKSFKKIHRRFDPPHFPISLKAHYLTLVTIAIFEGVCNIAFYGEFKGVVTAILIGLGASVVNVIVAAFAGSLWRLKNSIRAHERKIGWLAFAGWFLYAIYLNAFLAFFRNGLDRLSVQIEDPIAAASVEASRTILSAFFTGFTQLDIISWFLFLFGLIVGVTAFLKGYQADDPYPRYGLLVRQHVAAKEAYTDTKKALRQSVEQLVRDADRKLAEIGVAKQKLYVKFHDGVQLVYKTLYDYRVDATAIVEDMQYLLKVYRSANCSTRSLTPPAYFNRPHRPTIPDVSMPGKWQKKSLEKLRIQLQRLVRNVQTDCRQARRELSQVSRLSGKRIDQLIGEVDAEAHNRIIASWES